MVTSELLKNISLWMDIHPVEQKMQFQQAPKPTGHWYRWRCRREHLQCLAWSRSISSPFPHCISVRDFGNNSSLHSELDSKPTIALHWLQEALYQARSELRTHIFKLPKEKFSLSTFLKPSKHFSTVAAFRARLRYTLSSTFATAQRKLSTRVWGFFVDGGQISSTKSVWMDKHPSSA